MKKYIIPLLFVLFLSVSCKKPDDLDYDGRYSSNYRVYLSVVSVGENKAHLKVESYQNFNEKSVCYIINKKTNTQLSYYYYNQATNSFEVDLYSLQPHTTYKVFGIVFTDYTRNRGGRMTNEVTFKTE